MLKQTGNATSGWTVTFTKTNNEYKLTKDGTVTLTKQENGSTTTVGWKENSDGTFTNGDVTLQVGDYVNYDVGTVNKTTVTSDKSGEYSSQTFMTQKLGWRVLGINLKRELELISDNPTIGTLRLNGEKGYLNAEDILNDMCNELYGKGEHATGARSLNVEDINKLGNYDPTSYDEYGDIWTYRFPISGDHMQYKRTKADGTLMKDWTDITESNYQTFRMLGETEAEKISTDNRTDTGRSLEYTYYNYTIADKVKQTTSDGKKMSDIISKGTESSVTFQWLASRCVYCNYGYAAFYVRSVYTNVASRYLYSSYGYLAGNTCRVRPVVSLKSDIQLSGNSNDGWTIN